MAQAVHHPFPADGLSHFKHAGPGQTAGGDGPGAVNQDAGFDA